MIIQEDVDGFSKTCIKVKNPREAFNILLNIFKPELKVEKVISSKAHIGKNVKIGENVAIMDLPILMIMQLLAIMWKYIQMLILVNMLV